MSKLVLIALSALLLAGPRTAPLEDPPTPTPQTFNRDELIRQSDDIQKEVAALRGWDFKHPVPTDVYDEAQLRKFIEKKLFEEQLGGGRLELTERFLHTVGLLPPGCDFRDTVMKVLLSQVGGFYDVDTKSFKMMQRGAPNQLINSVLVAHELTHALDDQYFDLGAYVKRSLQSEDESIAISSIIEGSATELMSRYMQVAMTKVDSDVEQMNSWMQAEMERSQTFMKSPPYFTTLIASYMMGMNFLLRGDLSTLTIPAAKQRIAADIKAAFKNPPLSSEQIIHPEKYWETADRDDPVTLDDAEFERQILAGLGKITHHNTVGEILCALLTSDADRQFDMMAAAAPDYWTTDGARGWGGDRFYLLDGGDPKAENGRAVWITFWDTPTDRDEFMEDYASHRKDTERKAIRFGKRGVVFTFGFTAEQVSDVEKRLKAGQLRLAKGGKDWDPQ